MLDILPAIGEIRSRAGSRPATEDRTAIPHPESHRLPPPIEPPPPHPLPRSPALTPVLGRLPHELRWEALGVPSGARRGEVNLIIFPDNLARRGALEIVNVGELPARP